jgi:hypothetical protein
MQKMLVKTDEFAEDMVIDKIYLVENWLYVPSLIEPLRHVISRATKSARFRCCINYRRHLH